MSKKQRIYVAEQSRILSKLISKELCAREYDVQIFADGLSALRQIVSETPDLIIADRCLPKIDGMQLCEILKDGSSKSSVPFVLISTDEKIFDFWNTATSANKTLSISTENFESLFDAVTELLAGDYIDADSFFEDEQVAVSEKETESGSGIENEPVHGKSSVSKSKTSSSKKLSNAVSTSDEEKMTSWIVSAMDRTSSFLQMTNNVIKLYSHVKDTDVLVEKLFSIIYDACNYDAITLILDSQNAIVYRAGTDVLDPGLSDEFWNICKTSYEHQAKKNHTITYELKEISGIVLNNAAVSSSDTEVSSDEALDAEELTENCSELQPEGCNKLKSYYDFVLCAENENEFVGTLHLASSKKKLFTYKVQSSIEYILPPLAHMLQQSVRYSAVTLMESKLRSAFLKFVPPQVIDDMLSSNTNRQQTNNNEKRNVVILMSDIRNFTSISEVNTPEDVVNFLNTYFTAMVNIVKKYGGTVDKFMGDALMVLFGAPISYMDNAKRAVCAAIEMYSQLKQIQYGQLKFPEGTKLDIGIGIHYGDVIVGNIGSEDKTDYTVIGDTVNLASRLEGLTKLYGAKILISQTVKNELDSSVNFMLLDSVKVMGKKESVQIYRVDEKPLPEEYIQIYEKGFKAYSEGTFSLAVPYFEKALTIMPEDRAARLMLDRCANFAVNKPETWDGAIALTSK
ncbi:MAG: response regulator [Treponemataceae bacterium]|nr:response regulator [Treponemataceae bacterium]